MPSRAATKIVLSPAIVPAIAGWDGLVDRLRERVRVAGRSRHDDERPCRLDRHRVAAHGRPERAKAVAVRAAGRRIDQPSTRRAHLHETEVGDVPGDGRLDDLEPVLLQRRRHLRLRRERTLAHELEDGVLSLATIHSMQNLSKVCVSRMARASPTSSAVAVSGGARRTTSSPAVRTSRPCSRAASTTSPALPSISTPIRSPRPRTDTTPARDSQPGRELRTARADALEQLVVDRADDRTGSRARDGVAAERRAVITGDERAGRIVCDEQRADRQAVRKPLGERDEIGTDAQLLECEERPGAPHARLDLVETEQRMQLARRGHERGVERDDASLAENRLEQDQPHVSIDGRVQRRDVVRRHEAHTGDERLERRPLARLSGRGERTEGAPVEAPLERDHAGPARRAPGVLQRCFDRLGARVAEERPCATEAVGEEQCEVLRRLGSVEVRCVPEAVELRVRSRERRRMTVTERDDGNPASEVQVLASICVPDAAPVAANDRQVCTRVRRKEPLEPS